MIHYTSVKLDKDTNTLLTRWLRTVNSREYRSGVSYFCKVIKKHKPELWLIDSLRLCSPGMEDQKWTVNKLCSLLGDSSLKKIAILLPDDLFLEVVTEKIREKIIRKTKSKIKVKDFQCYSQAHDWLQSVPDKEGLFREDAPGQENESHNTDFTYSE